MMPYRFFIKLIAVFLLLLPGTITYAQQADSKAKALYAQAFRTFTNGNEIKALDLATQASNLCSVKDSVTYTQSAIMKANLLGRRGDNIRAINTAFDILRQTDANHWQNQHTACLICIGDLYRSIADPFKALPYAIQANKEAIRLKDTANYISSLSLLAAVYSYTGINTPPNLNTAFGYLHIIFTPPYWNKLSIYYKAYYLSALGRVYREQNKFADAKTALLQSVAIAKQNNYLAVEKHSLNELMTSETDQGNFTAAIDYAKQTLSAQPAAQSNRIQIRDIYFQLSRAYEGLQDYKSALAYEIRYEDLRDSLNNLEKDRTATELAEKYKADKRLIVAANQEKEARLQRNFIILIAIILLLAAIITYRWFINKNKRESDLLKERHRQLARMDAMKTRFFANISHELRTPLTLIMGPTEQLLDKPGIDEQQQRGYLQAVFRNSKKLLNLVNELLDLGKIEAGTLSVKLKPVDIHWFINVIYQAFASAAAYKNITYTLTNHIDEHLFVQLDADKFEKIANNLLSNAIKFTPSRGSVNITAVISEGMIEFTVTDTGKGIHADDLPLIFDRYYQANRGGAEAEGGTGIGLAIAQEFSELMGGNITVKSTYGAGSTFKALVPKISVIADSETSEIAVAVEDIEEVAGGQGEKLVLLVEDHHEMAQYISSIIKPFYRVIPAYNGREALDMLKSMKQLPDLIISDVMMPEMDGFTLLNNLKRDAVLCKIPVIILTALGDNENRLKALHIGVDDYLTKPFISTELLARAANLIGNAAGRADFSAQDEREFTKLENDTNTPEVEPVKQAPHVSPADLLWLSGLEALVRRHIGKTDLNMSVLSDEMALSERQLFRRVKNITGLNPNRYIRDIRLQIAREAIESGRYRTVSEISYLAGFDTPAYFSKLFKEHYGRDVNELL